MNRLTEKIALVLISSSLVLSGCGQNDGEVAEGGDTTWGKDSARGSGSQAGYYSSQSGGYSSHSPSYFFGSQSYSNGGSHTGGSFFSSFGGSSRGGFGASAHGAGS